MGTRIKFGTSGWRAIIADTFTYENVRIAAQATADYFKTVEGVERGAFIGFDGRFLSQSFARAAAEVLAGNGFQVFLMDRPYPTPYVSFEVRRRRLAGRARGVRLRNPRPLPQRRVAGRRSAGPAREAQPCSGSRAGSAIPP